MARLWRLGLLFSSAAAAVATAAEEGCIASQPHEDNAAKGQALVQLAMRQHGKLQPGLEGLAFDSFTEDSEGLARAQGAKCGKDADCGWHAHCGKAGVCEAKALFAVPGADMGFAALSFFIAGISLAAGVGGGGLFVPLLMLVLSFDARTATGLSQSMLFGGASAAFLYNLSQRHPQDPSRPLVDFELTCLLAPALMTGAQIGSLVHAIAPPAVLLFLLCGVLFDASRKGIKSALKIRAKELESAQEQQQEQQPEKKSAPEAAAVEAAPAGPQATPAKIRTAQLKLLGVWLFTCTVILTKGLLVQICTRQWWAVVCVSCVCLLAFAHHYANELSQQEPDGVGLDFRQLAFPLVRWSLFAGLLAALCGIGGGMVLGPVLVGLKVPPPVSSATTATTLLLISSSTALVYWCRSVVPGNYSLFLSCVTACGALLGKSLIGAWVKRTGRDSVIVWCLAGITALSTLLMGALGIYRVALLGQEALMFSSLCSAQDKHLQGPTTGMRPSGG